MNVVQLFPHSDQMDFQDILESVSMDLGAPFTALGDIFQAVMGSTLGKNIGTTARLGL